MATHSSILAWKIPMDKGAWWAAVRGAPKSRTQLSDKAQHIHGVELIPVLNIKDSSTSHVSNTNPVTSKAGESIVNLSSHNFIRRKRDMPNTNNKAYWVFLYIQNQQFGFHSLIDIPFVWIYACSPVFITTASRPSFSYKYRNQNVQPEKLLFLREV